MMYIEYQLLIDLCNNIKIVKGVSSITRGFFITYKRVKEFLDLISNCGSVALASSKFGLSPLEAQEIIDNDPAFAKLIRRSLKLALEIAEGVLYERAVNGYTEETIVDGIKTGEKRKYSDSCLLSYLKANSGKYSNVKVVNGSKGHLGSGLNIELPEFIGLEEASSEQAGDS